MSGPGDRVKVLVVDDSIVCRAALRVMLEQDPDIEVVGEAGDGVEALEQLEKLAPSLITLDLQMPRMDGLTAIEEITRRRPTPILVITDLPTLDGIDAAFAALSRGALELILKPTAWPAGSQDQAQSLADRVKRLARVKVGGPRPASLPAIATPLPLPPLGLKPPRVVGIGASTGGPGALARVLEDLPATLTAPVLVVQHMDPAFSEFFSVWLARKARRPLRLAVHGERLQDGEILVAPQGLDLTVDPEGRVGLLEAKPRALHCPSVDALFSSLAQSFGDRAVGVLLTGMGQDGAEGMRQLHRQGAITIAQDEASCVVYGMPRAAAELGAVDHVLPLAAVGSFLGTLAGGRVSSPAPERSSGPRDQPRKKKKRILIVDDSELILAVTRDALEGAGYEVVTLSNPISLAHVVRREAPDLVLLDVNMPAITGDVAAGIVLRHGATIPMLLFSDLSDAELTERAKGCGAVGHVKKSADSRALLTQIRKWLKG